MIKTLRELQVFTESQANRLPALAKCLLLKSPGCSQQEIQDLLVFEPNLPPIYIKCLVELSLKGVSLAGGFRLWPGGNAFKGTFVEDFQRANLPYSRHNSELWQMGLLLAGYWNDAEIYVAKRDSPLFEPDSVVRFDDEEKVNAPIVLCGDFEKFLIASANVAEIFVTKKASTCEEQIMMFLDILPSIGLTDGEVNQWRVIAEVAYS